MQINQLMQQLLLQQNQIVVTDQTGNTNQSTGTDVAALTGQTDGTLLQLLEAAQTTGIELTSGQMQSLSSGTVFEASILSVKNGQVTLGLADGETIKAKIELQMDFKQGSSVFFQVKSNDGSQISIKPYMQGDFQNPKLVSVLEQAGVEVNHRNLSLVQTMMEEQMPIDKSSMQSMVRTATEFPSAWPSTVVLMTKFNIPFTQGNLTQFENFQEDRGNFTNDIQKVMESIPEQLGQLTGETNSTPKDIIDFQQKILSVITEGQIEVNNDDTSKIESTKGQLVQTEGAGPSNDQLTEEITAPLEQSGEKKVTAPIQENPMDKALVIQTDQTDRIDNKGQDNLLKSAFVILDSTDKEQKTPGEKLSELSEFLQNHSSEFSKEQLKLLFSSPKFQSLVGQAMERQWLLEPNQVKQEEAITKLYEKLERQMGQLQKAFDEGSSQNQTISQTMNQVKDHIQFMNELNHLYQYVQIPLKLAGQHANGELYVLTNKKNLSQKKGELTAHLHLDMEHLGMTDVLVNLKESQLSTHFMLEKESSFDLIEEHIGELTQRLEEKGYQVQTQVENKEAKTSFVKDFLNREKPVGEVQRYSIDVRA